MSAGRGVVVQWLAVVLGSAALLLVGALVMYGVMRTHGNEGGARSDAAPAAAPDTHASTTGNNTGRLPDVIVPIGSDAAERAGIVVGTVSAGRVQDTRRFPATVQPNAYKRVTVTSLFAARITRVVAELGQAVDRGAVLADVFSPELSDAETRYVSLRAELDAHERQLRRTEQLVDIGAASRQELDMLHAEHTAKLTEIGSARARLLLLGLTSEEVGHLDADGAAAGTTAVRAPISGVVIERTANAGLTVETGAPLFTIADLSTVWVIADVFERDFSRVHQGLPATVTFAAYPDAPVQGTVSYIDPQLDPQTRTAKLRVEVANRRGDLRVGTIADVTIALEGTSTTTVVAASAIQHVGDRTVVYLVRQGEPGQFVEREVHVGEPAGDDKVTILDGVQQGDSVVTQGSFAIRAEQDRLGLRAASPSPAAGATPRSGVGPSAR